MQRCLIQSSSMEPNQNKLMLPNNKKFRFKIQKNKIQRFNSIPEKQWLNQADFPSKFFINVVMMTHSLIFTCASLSIFIFGNSLVETRNNNYMTMLFKVNMWYNVIDFTNFFPTGRFCNGRIQRHLELSQQWNSHDWMFPFQNPRKNSIVMRAPRNVFVSPYPNLHFTG